MPEVATSKQQQHLERANERERSVALLASIRPRWLVASERRVRACVHTTDVNSRAYPRDPQCARCFSSGKGNVHPSKQRTRTRKSTCVLGVPYFIDHHKRELLEYLLSRSPFFRRWNYFVLPFPRSLHGSKAEAHTCLQCARCTEDESPAKDLSPKSRLGGLPIVGSHAARLLSSFRCGHSPR